MVKVKEKRAQCRYCPITASCTAPKEDRWRDFLYFTAREEDCPLVRVVRNHNLLEVR